MRESVLKGLIAAVGAGVLSYFHQLAVPVLMLTAVMVLDYLTGLVSAGIRRSISSRTGLLGIVKKVCYLALVAVGGCIDWLLINGMAWAGVETPSQFPVGLVITLWLIVNELISIIENLGEIPGFPLPGFLISLLEKLREDVSPQGKEKED